MSSLAITGGQAVPILAALAQKDETAWTLTATCSRDSQLLLGRTLDDVAPDAYVERGPRHLRIASRGFVLAFGRAARRREGVVFVHTHPGGDPAPSKPDDEVDELLAELAETRGAAFYAALNVGGSPSAPRISGRLHRADGSWQALERLRIAGNDMRVVLAEDAGPAPAKQVFDRQVRAFGAAGQELLSQLHVGVVGAGGTGSAAIEQLARLGVGRITVIDDDTVDITNVTRIHGSAQRDVAIPKAELAKRAAEAVGTGCRAEAHVGTVATRAAVEALSGCDVVLGCTDDHAGRFVLSLLAYRYLLPVIDCAVMVDSDGRRARGVFGRVTIIAPGEPCLVCRGEVDMVLAGEELLAPAERQARASEGYARGAGGPAPSVVAFTTLVASWTVHELLGRLLGYSTSTAANVLLRPHDQIVRPAGGGRAQPGHVCADPEAWGVGDTDPPLGIMLP